jgi:hypothetical protein
MSAVALFIVFLIAAAIGILIAHANNKLKFAVNKKDTLRGIGMMGALFLMDVLANKVLDKPTGYMSTFVDGIPIPVIDGWMACIAILIALLFWVGWDAFHRKRVLWLDIIMYTAGLLSFTFLMGMEWLMMSKPDTTLVPVIGSSLITTYHMLGIGTYITTMVYFAITEPTGR